MPDFVEEPENNPVGKYVYFDDVERDALNEIAEIARQMLTHNPDRATFDAWQAKFNAIEPSFYPIVTGPSRGRFSKDAEPQEYVGAWHRLHPQAV